MSVEKNEAMDSMLSVVADMEDFCHLGDKLSRIIGSDDEAEIEIEDLDMVSAAQGRASYKEFLKSIVEKRKD